MSAALGWIKIRFQMMSLQIQVPAVLLHSHGLVAAMFDLRMAMSRNFSDTVRLTEPLSSHHTAFSLAMVHQDCTKSTPDCKKYMQCRTRRTPILPGKRPALMLITLVQMRINGLAQHFRPLRYLTIRLTFRNIGRGILPQNAPI